MTTVTREEFDQISKDGGFETEITDRDYSIIEFVYQFHPCISETYGKKQIADLVGIYGMRIVKDMLPTARKAKEIEEKMSGYRGQIEFFRTRISLLRDELADLRNGKDSGKEAGDDAEAEG